MTITSVHSASESDADLAARFAREAEPLFDVLPAVRAGSPAATPTPKTCCRTRCCTPTRASTRFGRAPISRRGSSGFCTTGGSARYRSKQRRPAEVAVDEVTERRPGRRCGPARRPRSRSAEAEVLDALPDSEIKAALDALPDGFRTAMYYADVAGLHLRRDRRDHEHPAGHRHVAGVTWPAAAAHRVGHLDHSTRTHPPPQTIA